MRKMTPNTAHLVSWVPQIKTRMNRPLHCHMIQIDPKPPPTLIADRNWFVRKWKILYPRSFWPMICYPKANRSIWCLVSWIRQLSLKCCSTSSTAYCSGYRSLNTHYWCCWYFFSYEHLVRCGSSCSMPRTSVVASLVSRLKRECRHRIPCLTLCDPDLTRKPAFRWHLLSMSFECRQSS